MNNLEWFHSLNKPFLSPPDWIFTPVWTTLYILMALALIIYIDGDGLRKEKQIPTIFFTIQLILNLLWPATFFGNTNILGGFIIIILLNVFILLTIVGFYKRSKVAAILLIPYLLWVMFATYLNCQFYIFN